METLQIGPWILKYDAEATRQAYSKINVGEAEACGCEWCLNFAAARDSVYPEEVRILLDQIGVDYRKEVEVFYCNEEANGLHCYGGAFHFVGILEYTDEAHKPSQDQRTALAFDDDAQAFVWAFSDRVGRNDSTFAGKSLVEFFFAARVPWVIRSEEPK